jgi:hypothetical protein
MSKMNVLYYLFASMYAAGHIFFFAFSSRNQDEHNNFLPGYMNDMIREEVRACGEQRQPGQNLVHCNCNAAFMPAD